MPRDAIDDDERLLIRSSKFVRLIEELSRLKTSQEVARGLVLDANQVAVRIVADFNRANIHAPLGELYLGVNLKPEMPLTLSFVHGKNRQTKSPS